MSTTTVAGNATTMAATAPLDPSCSSAEAPSLILVLAAIYSVITLGYMLRRLGVLTALHGQGIGRLIGRISLPALLFLSVVTINFSGIKWLVVLGVLLAKTIVFVLVGSVSYYSGAGCISPLAQAGLHAVQGTMSNDFAVGVPVILALFPPQIVPYLYLVAPINFIILNPVALYMIEKGTISAGLRGSTDQPVKVHRILINIVKNPIIYMILLGLVVNFMVDHKPPTYIVRTLTILKNAFSAGALLNLGGNIYQKSAKLTDDGDLDSPNHAALGSPVPVAASAAAAANPPAAAAPSKAVVPRAAPRRTQGATVPLLLTGAKSLLLPVLCNIIITAFGVRDLEICGESYSLALFGFIYGTLPAAPAAYIFAVQYGFAIVETAKQVVLSTVLAAPIMYVSIEMAQIDVNDRNREYYLNLLHEGSFDTSVVSSILLAWLLFLMFLTKWDRQLKGLNIRLICVLAFLFSISAETCLHEAARPWDHIRFLTIYALLFVLRLTIIYTAVMLSIAANRGQAVATRFRPMVIAAFAVVFVVLMAVVASASKPPEPNGFNGLRCWYGALDQTLGTRVVGGIEVFLGLIVLSAAVFRLVRTKDAEAEDGALGGGGPGAVGPASRGVELYSLEHNLLDEASNPVAADNASGFVGVGGVGAPYGSEDDDPDYIEVLPIVNEMDNDEDEDVPDTEEAARAAEEATMGREFSPQELARKYFLFFLAELLLLTVTAVVCAWVLISKNRSGLFIQIAFLDISLTTLQGMLIFILFGTRGTKTMLLKVLVITKRIRAYFREPVVVEKLPDSLLDASVVDAREAFRPHLRAFIKGYVRTRQGAFRKFPSVFKGDELVTYLVTQRICSDRNDATDFGQLLFLARLFHHIKHEATFEDTSRFYRFYDEPTTRHSARDV